MFIMTSASSQKSFLSKTINNTIDQLNDLNNQQSRGRSNRASSLALPNTPIIDLINTDQPILNPITLAPPPPNPNSNTRRHSSHHCPDTEIYNTANNSRTNRSTAKPQPALQTSAPPPVPKRTFPTKATLQLLTNDADKKPASTTNIPRKSGEIRQNFETKRSFCSDQISDDDRLSIESSVFDEPRTADLVNIEGQRSQFAKSNRSSSDSNKSHATIDTGYMSATTDTYRNILSGSSDEYRHRISSVDTQSSIDSYASDVHKGSISPFASKLCHSPFDLKPRDMEYSDDGRADQKVRSTDDKLPKCLPAVPLRKQGSVPKLPPPTSMGSAQRSRGAPPVPPMRSQTSLDSGKLLQNGQMFAAFQTVGQNITGKIKKQDAAQEMHQKPTKRNTGHKPPPLTQIHQSKVNQRQDSTISSDSFSQTSSPGYNSKSMEAPLIQYASRMTKSTKFKHQDSSDNFGIKYNYSTKGNVRQDSNVSSDSFSQTSSPGYNTKLMEAPLLAHAIKLNNFKQPFKGANDILKETADNNSNAAITKSASTPASLQTIVRFQNGSNMSLQHKILNRRKSSNPYITRGRLKFRLCQVILNAVALLAIAGGLAAYFNAHPTVKFINKTIITPNGISADQPIGNGNIKSDESGMSGIMSQSEKAKGYVFPANNPAPGVCLPIIVKFCQNANLPYNYTVFPNYVGHFGQPEVQTELDEYDALVDVQCYELVSLFLCSLFVPKCGNAGNTIPPCKLLCTETMRRCGFFFDVFGLSLPEYLNCDLFTDSKSCVGFEEVHVARRKENNPDLCTGFLCDKKRCIPSDWRCDGHVDCVDQTDESKCDACGKGSIYCGENRCMSQKHVCDGVADCPWGQDERNCVRLSDQNGDLGKGVLEVYKADIKKWTQVCVSNWEQSTSPSAVCSMLGYNSVNSTRIVARDSNKTLVPGVWPPSVAKKQFNSLKDLKSCKDTKEKSAVVELTCSNFECGKVRSRRYKPQTRIVGGSESTPGDWPFLAAILGGPEEIFYCAGVLIADQWVLTASHCIGNYGSRNTTDFTVQLGITRRHSHTYYGQKIPVSKLIPHPQYNSVVAHDNDIALFQLAKKVAFHEQLLPVCLPPEDIEIKPDTMCTVIGWGKREDRSSANSASSNSYEAAINEVQVPVLNRDLCNEWLDTLNVTDGMICAGYPEGGKDACQGDSGGPLLCRLSGNNRNKWFVGGIVSWGILCAHPKLPGVYANVPKYIPWIKAQMKQHTDSTVPTVSN